MIASKRDSSDIYSGCLAYLKNDLSAVLPAGKSFVHGGIKNLVGSSTVYNAHNSPWNSAPIYFEIYFGKKYILPTSYSLMGRRALDHHYLKSWDFYGKNVFGKWVLLHSVSNKQFSNGEKRNYPLDHNETYIGFKIQMTETDSNGEWALCLGQIEVFGDVYSCPFIKENIYCKKRTIHASRSFHLVSLSLLIVIIT